MEKSGGSTGLDTLKKNSIQGIVIGMCRYKQETDFGTSDSSPFLAKIRQPPQPLCRPFSAFQSTIYPTIDIPVCILHSASPFDHAVPRPLSLKPRPRLRFLPRRLAKQLAQDLPGLSAPESATRTYLSLPGHHRLTGVLGIASTKTTPPSSRL